MFNLDADNPFARNPFNRTPRPIETKLPLIVAPDQHKLPAAADEEDDFKTRIGKAIGAVGQTFGDIPELPVVPMLADNEQQRAQRLQMMRLPGYSKGGYAKAKKPIIVGEKGPEVFVPKRDGVVVPNVAVAPPDQKNVLNPQYDPWFDANTNHLPTLPIVTQPDTANVLSQFPDLARYQQEQNAPSVQPVLPTVTQPAGPENFGWNSDTPEMKAQREYDLNRPPTVDEAWKNYNNVVGQKEHPNKFLSGLFLALQGINKFANPQNQTPITTLVDAQHQRKIGEARAGLESLTAQDKYDQDRRLKDAQIKTIGEDDARLAGIAETNKADKATKAINKALDSLYKGKVFDKTNPAHRKQALAAGLDPDTMPSWDFNNPFTATVNGIKFERDRLTGEYSPTGLPESEKDKIVSIDVAVPGEKNLDGSQKIRKFNVPQSQAATISGSLQAAGMQIEAAKGRQTSDQEFQLKKQELGHNLSVALKDHEAAIEAVKNARDEQQKQDAERRAEDAKKRVAEYEANLKAWLDKEKQ